MNPVSYKVASVRRVSSRPFQKIPSSLASTYVTAAVANVRRGRGAVTKACVTAAVTNVQHPHVCLAFYFGMKLELPLWCFWLVCALGN